MLTPLVSGALPWRAGVAPFLLLSALASGCSRTPPSGPPPPDPETRRMVERLAALTKDPRAFNPFDLGPSVRRVEARLTQQLQPGERAALLLELSEMHGIMGDPAAALRAVEQARYLLASEPDALNEAQRAALEESELSATLRQGEIANCLERHNSDCCVFPLKDGGLHERRQAFEAAEALILERLRRTPDSYAHRWLLTVVDMALGKYPQKSDAALILPPKVFAAEAPFPRFIESSQQLGMVVDDIAGGAVLDDFTGDGQLDVVLTSWQKSGQMRFFVNQGGGKLVERTREAGLEGITGGLNALQADYDNDGWLDLYIVRGAWLDAGGRDPDSLLRNRGDGTFVDRTEAAGLLSSKPALTATWADLNNDGNIDLFVACESMRDTVYPPELYLNRGNGTFLECARASGVAAPGLLRGVSAADYDGDAWTDLYVSRLGQENLLYRNLGRQVTSGLGWAFDEVAKQAGVTEPLLSFPCWFWDYDNDGWQDLFTAGYTMKFGLPALEQIARDIAGAPSAMETPRLYRNLGNGRFADVTREADLARVVYAMGCNFGDLDSDGWLDIYAGTGDPSFLTLIPNQAFRNVEGKRFADVTTAAGLGHLQKGHGIAFGDLNGDGHSDLLVNLGGAARGDNFRDAIFLNPGFDARWLHLRLEGKRSNRAAIGARVRVVVETDAGLRTIHRTVSSGGSFGASTLRLEIGLGQCRRIRELEVTWPASGEKQRFTGVELDASYRLREGDSGLTPSR